MLDVSIVILNWKVKDLLRRCLASVYAHTKGVQFEVLVVDNDSADGSVEMIAREFPQATLIVNNRNIGFAAGNNPAIARAQGSFILLLNPDTELQEDAITKMVTWMRKNPHAAIMGPRLQNTDGTLQESVRAFPTIVSQALIMLKLHHVFPKVSALKKYFAKDFDYRKSEIVDQVMGAAFMIRRSVLEQIGLLDERFFIWFEEVDYCKRAKDAGLEVWYVPCASVTHHGGESFGQVFGPKKQQMFNDSLRKYFLKHFGVLAWLALTILDPFSKALAWCVALRKSQKGTAPRDPISDFYATYRLTILLIILFELLSFGAYLLSSNASSFVWIIIVGATTLLALKRFDLAVLILLAELFVGSQGGYLVTLGAAQGLGLSLRQGLFLAVVGVWLAEMVAASIAPSRRREDAWAWLRRLRAHGVLFPYISLIAVLGLGILRGILRGNAYNVIFFDVDRSLYYGLFPALVVAFSIPAMRRRTAAVLTAAVTTSVAKALLVLFFFSHRVYSVAATMYLWIRDTRVGEITIMAADFYRIFFQSQIFILTSCFVAALLYMYARERKGALARVSAAFFCWSMVSMLLSLSRSFWFGGAVATVLLTGILIVAKAEMRIWKRFAFLGVGSIVVAIATIAAVYYFPFPNKSGSLSLASLFSDRAMSLNDSAASSRWALLPKLTQAAMAHPVFGSGYGTTVTYTTSDPRLLATNNTASYTTYAFEWGYHDLWLKIGLVGLAVYGWFIIALALPLLRVVRFGRADLRVADFTENDVRKKSVIISTGVLAGLIALLATNIFSPYLNHPLGIGILMIIAALGVNGAFDVEKTV